MSYNLYSMKHRPTGVTRRHHPAPGPRRTPGESGTGGMQKEVPCFVSKGQHSKRGKFEVQILRPRRTLDSRRRPGATTRPGEAEIRSRVPYRPRRPAAARRCTAPWRGAPRQSRGRAPAGGSPAPSPGRLLHHHRPSRASRAAGPASAGCPMAAAQSRRGAVRDPSAKAWVLEWARVRVQQPRPRPGFAPTPRASEDPPAARSPLHPPRPSASASVPPQLSGKRFPRAPRLPAAPPPPKGQAPSPPSAAWLLTRRSRPLGSAGAARDPPAPRGPLPATLPRALCVRAAIPSAELFWRRRLGRKSE